VRRERIGILGGTFNPVHSGHLRAAEAVAEQFGLDVVFLIPSYIPPHKDSSDIVPAGHRLKMLELACGGQSRCVPSDIEVKARGKSYSILTLKKIRRLHPKAWVFFILGVDAFVEIETWKDYEQVLDQCLFIVISRPGYDLEAASRVLGGRLRGRIRVVGPEDRPEETWFESERVFLVRIDALDVSSTDIRRRLREGRPVSGLVPRSVEDYLHHHRLYKETMAQTRSSRPSSAPSGKRSLPSEVRLSVKAGQAKKAEDTLVLDLRALSAFTDFFVIMHGQSGRQNAALAENIEVELKRAGVRPLGVEGKDSADWILMDYGFFVVHIFSKEKRDYYGLEKLWGDARKLVY
jgi:nicotinate-nucleotide adenylyltransferase